MQKNPEKQTVTLFRGAFPDAWELADKTNPVVLDAESLRNMMFGQYLGIINRNIAFISFWELIVTYIIENMNIIIMDNNPSDATHERLSAVIYETEDTYKRSIKLIHYEETTV